MSAGVTRLSDLIVPEIFTPYAQNLTKEKSRLIRSGAIVDSSELSALLNGEGLTFNVRSFRDLDNDEENTSNDDPADHSTPNKIGSLMEVQVRLSRNNSWSSMDLNTALMTPDPMDAIGQLVASYWTRREQRMFIATMTGVFADNAAAPTGDDTHIQNDMTVDISALSGDAAKFNTSAFIDTTLTMGDSMEDLTLCMMHSVVYGVALKNNLIDFVVDSSNGAAVRIPTFLGREVVVDDGMTAAGGIFQTWMFGRGALRKGAGSPKVPTATSRSESAGKGSGQETLHNRVEWALHPVGHAYIGTPANGGPSNAATANNLANAASWSRRFPERKQIPIARLITKEF